MSAAANAAGYLYASGRIRRQKHLRALLKPKDGEVEALARQLVQQFNVSPERAKVLAQEQAAKRLYGRKP